MKKCYTTPNNLLSLLPQRMNGMMAGALLISGFLATGLVTNKAHAQCVTVETGDITGNVSYGSSINWANPNRVEISDDLYARTSLNADDTTKYLSVTDFGYAIPLTATITGIEVAVEVHMETALTDARDASVRLQKAGTPVGSDYANPASLWQDKDNFNYYGGPTDLWGTTWTPADINSLDFGVLFSVTRLSGPDNEFVNVDYVTLTVYYTDVSCILPVTLSYLDAEVNAAGSVTLNWSTQSEMNNSHFEVERSTDGIIFSTVGVVAGAGNSSTQRNYQFEDVAPASGLNQYRLRQVDFNGQTSYSEIVTARIAAENTLSVTAYPNPATDRLTVSVPTAETFKAQVMDLQGKVLRTAGCDCQEDQIDLTGLSAGMYLLRVDAGMESQTTRIVKR